MYEVKLLEMLFSTNINASALTRLLLATLLALTSTGCRWADTSNRKASELKTEVQKELTPGASYADVIAFLNRKHIEHTAYAEAGDDKELLKQLGAPGRIEGVIRNVQRGLFSRSDIRLVFLFDEQGKMSSYDVVVSITT